MPAVLQILPTTCIHVAVHIFIMQAASRKQERKRWPGYIRFGAEECTAAVDRYSTDDTFTQFSRIVRSQRDDHWVATNLAVKVDSR